MFVKLLQATKFRKGISVLLVCAIILPCLIMQGSALELITAQLSFVTASEKSAVEAAMDARGLGGEVSVECLYNAEGQAKFLLGVSKAGYLIMSRDSLLCIECGEGNPYREYVDSKKYYGGVLCYYIADNIGYYDLSRGKSCSSMTINPNTYDLKANVSDATSESNRGESEPVAAAATATVTRAAELYSNFNWIRRHAFGFNVDGTCSAVATTLALNYLDYHNGHVVPSRYHLEELTGIATASDVATLYPKAEAFHQYIISCGMGIGSFADFITEAIDNYRNSSFSIFETGINCVHYVNLVGAVIKPYLDCDRPAMLTSTFFGDIDTHTMLVYGYREFSDGSTEWLVHPGWYNSVIQVTSGGVYAVEERWVSNATATFFYVFSLWGDE